MTNQAMSWSVAFIVNGTKGIQNQRLFGQPCSACGINIPILSIGPPSSSSVNPEFSQTPCRPFWGPRYFSGLLLTTIRAEGNSEHLEVNYDRTSYLFRNAYRRVDAVWSDSTGAGGSAVDHSSRSS